MAFNVSIQTLSDLATEFRKARVEFLQAHSKDHTSFESLDLYETSERAREKLTEALGDYLLRHAHEFEAMLREAANTST